MSIREGRGIISGTKEEKVTSRMEVFYNPVMKHNRDVSVMVLKTIGGKMLKICLPLEASGIRGIRFFKELPKGMIEKIYFNDHNEKAVKAIKANLKLNKIKTRYEISCQDANLFMRTGQGFDYIDIDPFGTPNPFLDSAIQAISRNGIIAVTATDTAALCGTSEKACLRKYWAKPMHDSCMHETGLRILIRKVQLIGAQYSKALIPMYSYSKDHYMRIFFKVVKGKEETERILSQHDYFKGFGPMWIGRLWDKELAKELAKQDTDKELSKMLIAIEAESRINTIGFYDLHEISGRLKHEVPKTEDLMKSIRKAGHKATITHFLPYGIRSTITEKELARIISNL
ncbi:MAG: tRNA (guanine(26)-N(2))-dimethyltransferase [Candidatus Woesearchaeota archaeon]